MSDYISRQAAIEVVNRVPWSSSADHTTHKNLICLLELIQTSDVVEVVRCKDCKHIKEEHFKILPDGFSCELSGLMVEPEHYCSYGERAEK